MKPEIRVATTSLRVIVPVTLISAVTIIILALFFRGEFGAILLAVAFAIVGVAGIAVIGKASQIYHGSQIAKIDRQKARQELRMVTAQADRAVLESYVLHVHKNERMIIAADAPVRLIEAALEAPKALPAETTIEQAPLDLLTVFTQVTQSYAIIGGQQTGKTYQARHIAAYWLSRGIQPWVVGPKWDKGEWAGCQLFGGRGDMEAVGRGIEVVRREAEKRHADMDLGHKEHSILPVFFDDWTPIVEAVDNARELVLEATTLYASVNIILYFILHSDTANAWGVDRKGAALKDNFVKLFIQPHYSPDGQVIRERTRGYIRFAGESTDRPTKLFTGPVRVLGRRSLPQGKGFPQESEGFLEESPTEEEQQVLTLHEQGESYREITQAVWGQYGKFYNDKVDEIIAKWGEK